MSSSPHPGELAGTSVADVVPMALLADEDCRAVLRILPTLPQPVSERTLATHVTAFTRNRTLGDIPTADRAEVQLSLRHRELPKLERAGLLNHDPDAKEVSLVQRFDYDEQLFENLDSSVDTETWDAYTTVHRHAHRMRIVEELADSDGGLSRLALAEALVDSGVATDGGRPVPEETAAMDVADVESRLHHVDLPMLAAADVLSYDPETTMVEPADESLIEELRH